MFSLNMRGLNLQKITVHNAYIDTVNESNYKPDKL